MGIKKLLSIEAQHCPEAYGSLVIGEGFSILYSGDTLPVQSMISYGKEVSLLIHEATLDDSLEADAKEKWHTTTGQAINQGKLMQAWRTCLTHFSPRYQKIAETGQRNLSEKVMIALELLQLSLGEFERAF